MLCKVEEVRREMESRLDSQRRHMVQKESQLKNEVEELKVTRLFNTPQYEGHVLYFKLLTLRKLFIAPDGQPVL